MPSPAEIRTRLRLRRARGRFIPGGLFADPSWDMLLDLYAAHGQKGAPSVSSLCVASGSPATTALRHIERLEQLGLITRSEDRDDRRRRFVSLTPFGLDAMDRYFRYCEDTTSARDQAIAALVSAAQRVVRVAA